jgi:hypothetical protein
MDLQRTESVSPVYHYLVPRAFIFHLQIFNDPVDSA